MVKSILASAAVFKHIKNSKLWWNEVYYEWNDRDFKSKMRLKRETFNVILEKFSPQIELTPTNLKSNIHQHIAS